MTDSEKLTLLTLAAQRTLVCINTRFLNIDGLGYYLEMALLAIGPHPNRAVFTPETLVYIQPRQCLIERANTDDDLFRALCEEDSMALEAVKDESDTARGM